MSDLQQFVADLVAHNGAAVESLGPDELEVLSPPLVQKSLGWPELARLGFGVERSHGAIPIGLEGDWMDRLAALLHEEGRWGEREVQLDDVAAPSDPQRVLDRALILPNAICRLRGVAEARTRCLILTFRYTAVSDEKREGLISLGFNTGTGAVINDFLTQLRPMREQMPARGTPSPAAVMAAGPRWRSTAIEARLRPLIDRQVRDEIEPFLRAMRRRLARDCNRVHAYYDGLHATSSRRLAALSCAEGERANTDSRRESMRIKAIERDYHTKLDDLRRNYMLRVTVEWVQTLELYVPVQRFDVLIRRRKGERAIQLDWHALVKTAEEPLCEAGLGRGRVRLVCDEMLHLTEPAAQDPCASCEKPFCRACFPASCPRCGAAGTCAPTGASGSREPR